MIGDVYQKPHVVFGCGNTLLGDDGFGPAVIGHLERHCELPEGAVALDVGTAGREYLFDLLLSPRKPRKIIILDAADLPGCLPGELSELDLAQVSAPKVHDFSLHQFPSVNLLQELQTLAGVEVQVLAVKVSALPDRVSPGLSEAVARALPRACAWVLEQLGRETPAAAPKLAQDAVSALGGPGGAQPPTTLSEGHRQ